MNERPQNSAVPLDDRLVDLLLQRATLGLTPDEGRELSTLLASADPAAVAQLERTVETFGRALDAADVDAESVPSELRARIMSSAAAAPRPEVIARLRRSAALGWLAAAAAFAIAAIVWMTRPAPVPSAPSLVEQVDAARDVTRIAFAPQPGDLSGASGEVVWSDARQEGYLRLRGVAPNDPKAEQFQLWVIDPKRDAKPVDGGVFDVATAATTSDGSVIVPFRPRLPVEAPAAFAITSEKPGGVVQTDGPILLLAAKPAPTP